MEFKHYVNKEIANRIYADFISWGELINADSFGYYMDGEPWIRKGTAILSYSKWKKIHTKDMTGEQLDLFEISPYLGIKRM